MSLPEEIMNEVMMMTDEQKYEVLDLAKALRQKEKRDLSALIDKIITENEEAFKELAK